MKRTKEKISDLTTYRFGGVCENVVTIESVEDVLHIEDEIRDNNYYIIGKGSNVAFSDKSFEKLLLIPQINNISIDSSTLEVSTGSGVFLPDLSRKLYNHSLTGGEFLLGIPGSVGGAIRMNAGCWGSEISNILQSITVYDFNNKTIKTIEKSQFKFGYRDGDFLKNYLILSGKFQFLKSNKDDIYKIMSELNTKRKSSQPSAIYNAGSVFKNPEKNSAGYLIESCGLKGFSIDKVKVSEKHANFFIAEKGAKAISLYELVQHVKNVVKEKHDILLEEEIKFVGNFE
jgi:UDP-N-acetylmuramate dehydrogenase